MASKPIYCLTAAAMMALIGGCQEPTGYDFADPYLVAGYENRTELSALLKKGGSHCSFGCGALCSMSPEPRVLVQESEELFVRYAKLRERAEQADLLLDVPKSGIVADDFDAPGTLDPADAQTLKRSCLQKQGAHLDRIEALVDTLAPAR